jgi:hypothetical protein
MNQYRTEKPDEEVISFIHLYDDTFAYFPKYARDWIVFPQDFIPATNKKYECQIQWTFTGSFTYNNKRYDVARAYPIGHGSIMDTIENKTEERREKNKFDSNRTLWQKVTRKKQPKPLTAMEIAFKKAKGE